MHEARHVFGPHMGYSRLSCLDNFRFQWPSPVVFKGFCRFSCFKTLSIFHATRESSSKISRNRKKDKIPWIWKISRNRKIDKIPFEFEKCFGPQVPVKHVNPGFGPGVPVIHMNSFHFTCGNFFPPDDPPGPSWPKAASGRVKANFK